MKTISSGRSRPRRPSADPAVRDRALRMVEQGVLAIQDIADILHVHRSTVNKWVAEAQPKPAKVLTPAPYVRGLRYPGGRTRYSE
jgi:transposase-like protein